MFIELGEQVEDQLLELRSHLLTKKSTLALQPVQPNLAMDTDRDEILTDPEVIDQVEEEASTPHDRLEEIIPQADKPKTVIYKGKKKAETQFQSGFDIFQRF